MKRASTQRRRRRVPSVTQVAPTECGLCVAVAILRYFGRAEEIAEAREVLDAGRDGTSIRDIGAYLRSRGLEVRSYRVANAEALSAFSSPVILFWEKHHFVILERVRGDHALIMDPAVGRRRITRDQLAAGFSGVVLAASLGPDFEPRRAAVLHEWRRASLFPEGSRSRVALVGLLSLIAYGALLGMPAMTQWAVDRQTHLAGSSDFAVMAIMVAAAAGGYLVLHYLRTAVMASLMVLIGQELMTDTFSRLLRLPYRFFSVRQPGELLFRLNSVNAIRDMLATRIAQGVLDLGTFGAVTAYLFIVEWRIALVALVLVLVNAVLIGRTRSRVLELVDEEISQLSLSQSLQLDAIVSITSIRMGGYEDQLLDRWKETYSTCLRAMKRRIFVQEGQIGGMGTVTGMFGPLLLLLAGLHLVQSGAVSLGAAVAIQMVSATYFGLSSSVFGTYSEFAEASRYMARINEITLTEPEDSGGEVVCLDVPSISLSSVSFQYTRQSELVLDEVSFTVQPGERLAIVGASGSGKSTLARIICGLYPPTTGTVDYGSYSAVDYDRRALRRFIGFVPQEVHLHNRSLLDNLTLGRDLSQDEVETFCAEVGILDFVATLPMGLQTLVTEMGSNFSGGQRQRLAIMRTLLQRPQILVLDEATSSLDAINERRVNEYLERLGITQIVVAHRLDTIRTADRIVVMDQGRVVEIGVHEELLGSGGRYTSLYAANGRAAHLGFRSEEMAQAGHPGGGR